MLLNGTYIGTAYVTVSQSLISGRLLGTFIVQSFRLVKAINDMPSARIVLCNGTPIAPKKESLEYGDIKNLYNQVILAQQPLFITLYMLRNNSPSNTTNSTAYLTTQSAQVTEQGLYSTENKIFSGYIMSGQCDIILRRKSSQDTLLLSCRHHAAKMQINPFTDAVWIPLKASQLAYITNRTSPTSSALTWYLQLPNTPMRIFVSANNSVAKLSLKLIKNKLGYSDALADLGTVLLNITADISALQLGMGASAKLFDEDKNTLKKNFILVSDYILSNTYLASPKGFAQFTALYYYKRLLLLLRKHAMQGSDIWSMVLSATTGAMRFLRLVPKPIYLNSTGIDKLRLLPDTLWGSKATRIISSDILSYVVYAATPGILFTQPDIIRVQFSQAGSGNNAILDAANMSPSTNGLLPFSASGIYVNPSSTAANLLDSMLLRHKTMLAPLWAALAVSANLQHSREDLSKLTGQQKLLAIIRNSKLLRLYMDSFAEATFAATYRNIDALSLQGPFSMLWYYDLSSPWYHIDLLIGKKIAIKMAALPDTVHANKLYIGNVLSMVFSYTSNALLGQSSFTAQLSLVAVHLALTDISVLNVLYTSNKPVTATTPAK